MMRGTVCANVRTYGSVGAPGRQRPWGHPVLKQLRLLSHGAQVAPNRVTNHILLTDAGHIDL